MSPTLQTPDRRPSPASSSPWLQGCSRYCHQCWRRRLTPRRGDLVAVGSPRPTGPRASPPSPSHPPTCRPRVVGDGDRVPVLLGVDGEEPHAEAAVVGEGSAVVKVLQVDAELVAALHRQHVDPLQPCGRGRGGVGGPRRGWGGWEPLGRGHGVGQGAVPTLQPSLLLPHG